MLVGCSLYISNKSSAPFPCLCFSLPTFHFSSAYGECGGSVKSLLLVFSNGFQMLPEACPWRAVTALAACAQAPWSACLDVAVGKGKGHSIGTGNFLCDPWFVTGKPVNNWFPPPFLFFFHPGFQESKTSTERGLFWLQVGLLVWIYAVLQTLI